MAATVPPKHLYREAMEQVHTYNSKLLLDRRLRMPYIDNQTGLAQQDCHLWVSRVQRCAPLRDGQIYSYPSRRWRVRKRPDFVGSSKNADKPKTEDDTPEEEKPTSSVIIEEQSVSFDTSSQNTTSVYEDFYEEEPFDSEFDSDEEFGSRRKKRKSAKMKGKKNALALKLADKIRTITKEELNMMPAEDRKKPYDCQICGKRYKNQQGLRYHYEHHNHDLEEVAPPPQPAEVPVLHQSGDMPPADHVAGAKRKKGTPPSSYCDFCLGSAEVNKKSGSSEELISCSDCGRSGHPSCLQFDANLTEQVKRYKWQCIECKCCCLCGTSDNDEQLLFCDACDRGYHMYCLRPPLTEAPAGSWQCQLCEARVKGLDISKVAVLTEHMDVVLR